MKKFLLVVTLIAAGAVSQTTQAVLISGPPCLKGQVHCCPGPVMDDQSNCGCHTSYACAAL